MRELNLSEIKDRGSISKNSLIFKTPEVTYEIFFDNTYPHAIIEKTGERAVHVELTSSVHGIHTSSCGLVEGRFKP
jgi:hypothetical protein